MAKDSNPSYIHPFGVNLILFSELIGKLEKCLPVMVAKGHNDSKTACLLIALDIVFPSIVLNSAIPFREFIYLWGGSTPKRRTFMGSNSAVVVAARKESSTSGLYSDFTTSKKRDESSLKTPPIILICTWFCGVRVILLGRKRSDQIPLEEA